MPGWSTSRAPAVLAESLFHRIWLRQRTHCWLVHTREIWRPQLWSKRVQRGLTFVEQRNSSRSVISSELCGRSCRRGSGKLCLRCEARRCSAHRSKSLHRRCRLRYRSNSFAWRVWCSLAAERGVPRPCPLSGYRGCLSSPDGDFGNSESCPLLEEFCYSTDTRHL